MPLFRRVLVANRGEIACRVMRALDELSIESVAVYSDVDRDALHVRKAKRALRLGAAPASESYLNIERVIAAAKQCGAEAIHPGYGFLSENADFAAACEAAGIVFIGPPASAIRAMGSKTEARARAIAAGTPVTPGSKGTLRNVEEALAEAERIGYPVMLKATAGGGGKGMRRVDRAADLPALFRDAASEAERSFRSGDVYLEKLILRPRHVEIQVLGDRHGHMIHLGERECSLQRRHQKVIEECPSPFVSAHPELRARMGQAAVAAAKQAGYFNAGTCEFLVDDDGGYYFLEMNTRLQVEHPVTEQVTGVDLVHWQLRIAAGEKLTLQQEDIQWRGWSMECRVYAEDPDQGFLPSPGLLTRYREPNGPGVRLDAGVFEGWNVPLEYDPLLTKLIVTAPDRAIALERLRCTLAAFEIGGIRHNLRFFAELLQNEDVRAARLHTGWLDEWLRTRVPAACSEEQLALAAIAWLASRENNTSVPVEAPASQWKRAGRMEMMR
jgi:acetyl-CoA carboxylase, biotin carboxylase subunit